MHKAPGFEVGKTYTLKNGNKITVTDIGRRTFDNTLLVSYRVEETGNVGDSTPNSLHWSIAEAA